MTAQDRCRRRPRPRSPRRSSRVGHGAADRVSVITGTVSGPTLGRVGPARWRRHWRYTASLRRPGIRRHIGSETDIPVAWRPGCPHRSHRSPPRPEVHPHHAAAPSPAPRAVHRRTPARARALDRRRQGPAGRAPVHPRPPLPARRGHALGRRPGRLLPPVGAGPGATPRPTTSCSAACTSWPSRPTCSPATTSR